MIYDNFLDIRNPKEEKIFKELQDLDKWFALNNGENGYSYSKDLEECYNWWDGKTEPKNVWEELIKLIWFEKFVIDIDKIKGFEYWANILSENNDLEWHQDKDEVLWNKTGETVSPTLSTVYYGVMSECEGGFLEIALPNVTKDQKETAICERVAPLLNRAVIFDPSRWHRVMPITSGLRGGFQVNIWEEVPSFVSPDTLQPLQDI